MTILKNFSAKIINRLHINCLIFICLCFICFYSSEIYAQEEGADHVENSDQEISAEKYFELEEIVVTATRQEKEIQKIPKNVTVITSYDIEQAPGNNIVDLLKKEAGLNLRSFFGTDKQSSIDIRGMGATSVSNVIVMVDGYRLNAPDLAGADFSSIPLDQIERIEIVRGAGSVVYGDGAVGGVINIITKKGQIKPETRIYTSMGSYNTFDTRASFRGHAKNLFFNVNADYYDSDGYRKNGNFRKKDMGLNLEYDLLDYITLSFSGSHHEDDYGLPGAVKHEDINSGKRRKATDHPDDSGETEDKRFTGGLEIDFSDFGLIKIHRGYRFRDNSYVMGYTPLKSREDQTDHINEDTKNFDFNYFKSYGFFGLSHKFQCGADHFKTEYYRKELSRGNRENSEIKNLGLFFLNQSSLSNDLSLNFGFRRHSYKGKFRKDTLRNFGNEKIWVNGATYKKDWRKNAYETGVVYSINSDNSLFANFATSFRIPNADEFAQADSGLSPQKGEHFELGSRHKIKGMAEISASLFLIKIEDEIYYGEDPDTGESLNRNYDEKTIRKGFECDIKVYPVYSVYLWGNYSCTTARFEKKDTHVPLVPVHKFSIGVEWKILDNLLLSTTGMRVGSRYDGNDMDNNMYPKLKAYEIVDCKLSYTCGRFKIFAGANNIFNELYSTVSYSNRYYPMPDRNFYGGVDWVY